MKPPRVSVVVGAYNCGRTIQETVRSVIAQTFQDWELILVDDGSTDDTGERLGKIGDSRVSVMRLCQNSGLPAVPRNRGLAASRGELVAFLDGDDLWLRHKLETQLPQFLRPEIVGVACDAAFIAETPYFRRTAFGRARQGYVDYGYREILDANPIITSSVIVRRSILDAAGLFDEDRRLAFIEDWDLWLRMARLGPFRVLQEPLIKYRVSRKRGEGASAIAKHCLCVLQKQVELGYVADREVEEARAAVDLAIARSFLESDPKKSRRYYAGAFVRTARFKSKVKACVGILISLLPGSLKGIALLTLYSADSLMRRGRLLPP